MSQVSLLFMPIDLEYMLLISMPISSAIAVSQCVLSVRKISQQMYKDFTNVKTNSFLHSINGQFSPTGRGEWY